MQFLARKAERNILSLHLSTAAYALTLHPLQSTLFYWFFIVCSKQFEMKAIKNISIAMMLSMVYDSLALVFGNIVNFADGEVFASRYLT